VISVFTLIFFKVLLVVVCGWHFVWFYWITGWLDVPWLASP